MDKKQDLSHVDVSYVADLARIDLTSDEIQRYSGELDAIIEYVAQLSEIDVTDVPPMAHAVVGSNVLRQDEPQACAARAEVLANAPATAEDMFIRVPVVIEEEGA